MLMKKDKKKMYDLTCPECGMEFVISNPKVFKWDGDKGLIFPCPSCEKDVTVKKRKIKVRVIRSKKEAGAN